MPTKKLLILLVSLLSLATFTLESLAGDRIYKIGFLTDFTGPGAFWGDKSRLGAELAAKELKERGINIELIFGDSGLDTKRGLSEAHKLIFIDNVDALVSEFSAVTNAVYTTAQRANKLFIGSCAARKFLDNYPAAFKAFLEYEKGCREVAAAWERQKIKTPGYLKAQSEFGEWCEKGLKSIYPDLDVAEFSVGANVASQILTLRQRKVDALVIVGFESDALNTMKELSRTKWKVPLGGCAPDIFTVKILSEYPEVAEGGIGFGFKDSGEEFVNKVAPGTTDKHGMQGAANAYIMVKSLGLALSACSPDDLECQIKAMNNTGEESLLGFKGYKNRIADFESALFAVEKGKLQALQ